MDHIGYSLVAGAVVSHKEWKQAVELLATHFDLVDASEIEEAITTSTLPLIDLSIHLADVQARRVRDAARDQSNDAVECGQ